MQIKVIITALLVLNIVTYVYNYNYITTQYLILNKSRKKIKLLNNVINKIEIDRSHENLLEINNGLLKILSKKIITISPGGANGFYDLGTCYYIKSKYNLNDYIFSGASAGSWNSLFLCFNKDIDEFVKIVLSDKIKSSRSLKEVQQILKNELLSKYTEKDFDLENLFIGVTVVENFFAKSYIFTDFSSLEDAIDCCIASSNIPFLTGNLIIKYHNCLVYDGGFTRNPYLALTKEIIHITKSMWGEPYNSFTLLHKININEFFEKGYNDTKKNSKILDKIFNNNIDYQI